MVQAGLHILNLVSLDAPPVSEESRLITKNMYVHGVAHCCVSTCS